MDVIALELATPWLIATWILAVPLLAWAALTAPWHSLSECPNTRVWHGSIVVAIVLWSIQATVSGSFTFHLLAMAGMTLALGARLALVSAVIVVAVHCGIHDGHWQNLAAVWLAPCAAAIGTTSLVLRVAERRLPANFFIYIFVVAFFGTALSLVVAGIAALLLQVAATELSLLHALDRYAPYLLQLGFGEAMLTGMLITIGVVYRPQWIRTFDDTRYLKPR